MFYKLREIRRERNISVEKMREVLGLETLAAYYKKEAGSVKFTLADVEKISKFLGLSVEEIFFD
ncbi:MAG: helix-turn-helix transcriptional regulator [Oscillospiraceae bacterium]|nr:helix-turn-helix transcriptional regulator [Oscillospiraceae bacterium]